MDGGQVKRRKSEQQRVQVIVDGAQEALDAIDVLANYCHHRLVDEAYDAVEAAWVEELIEIYDLHRLGNRVVEAWQAESLRQEDWGLEEYLAEAKGIAQALYESRG